MTGNSFLSSDTTIDLTNCDREPIHILGHVQSYGCLIAVSQDWLVNHASTNVKEVLSLEAKDLIGTSLNAHLPAETRHHLRSKMQLLGRQEGAVRIFSLDVFEDGRLFDLSLHATGRSFVFEFEAKSRSEPRDDMAYVQPLIARIRRHGDVETMCAEATRALKALTGFDRVMVYQFAENGSGSVIAEAREQAMEPYLGLRYPASDIPKQARELYKRSPLRLIADVEGQVFPIVPEKSPEGKSLDLSLAVTRAVSPIHLEYLRNMGVAASLSVSILRKGELWGLFACHHRTPLYMDYEKRTAVELFAQLFSYELADKENDLERQDSLKAQALHDRLMTRLSGEADLFGSFEADAAEIGEVIEFDGIALYSDGRYAALGAAPTEQEFAGLARFLNTTDTSTIFATDTLAERYEGAGDFADRVAGLLALPISRRPRDYIVLFRREVAQIVTWAGNPSKPFEVGPNGIRLTPRKSFEAWQEVMKNRSALWSAGELRAAEALRVTLLEVVLKVTDQASMERERAQEQQELLIAELNHRVRNILNLIRGLVSQGRGETNTIETFTAVLDSRIQALARAHDQLTQKDWSSVSLVELIEIEFKAFIDNKQGRVSISGKDVLLTPNAFSTMALVIHELITNSAKYGALSDSTGSVAIELRREESGALLAEWREKSGPPVEAPKRRGFGCTIIEQSIPFELKGKADLRFRTTGVEADFVIPASYVEEATADEGAEQPEEQVAEPANFALNGTTLLVEDNMIIAMDARDMLMRLGAPEIQTASTAADALRILESQTFELAVLDVNLGKETSLPVAARLVELGIPFILATGYGATEEITANYPKAPILKKPYAEDGLKRALSKLGKGEET